VTDKDPARQTDEFYVPSPEELEQGLDAPPRRRRRDRAQPDRHRGESRASWARRLFRIRPGVGQKRTEAPPPTPIPPRVDSPPAAPRTEPDPPINTEPVSSTRSLPSAPPSPPESRAKPPETRSGRSVPPPKGDKPSSSVPSKQRLRRIAIPDRRQQPPVEEPDVPFPEYLLDRPKSLGHQFGQFTKNRSFSGEDLYEGSCTNCDSKAIARHSAPENWTTADAGMWDLRGAASDTACKGTAGATVGQ